MEILQKPVYIFPGDIHPNANLIKEQTTAWICSNYLFLEDHMQKKYKYSDFGYFTARCLPHQPYESLLPCTRFMLWATIFDDYYEYCTAEKLSLLRERITAIFNGDAVHEKEHFFLHEAAVIRDELSALMPDIWMKRFIKSFDAYMESMLFEIPYKIPDYFPTLDEFFALREITIGIQAFIDLIEFQTKEILPDSIYYSSFFRDLYTLTARISAWCNDFYSIRKDLDREPLNLVLVLKHHYKLSLEKANEEALRLHNDDVQQLINLQQNIPDFGEYTETVRQFVFYLGVMIQGQSQWYSKDTRRYLEGGHPDLHTFKNIP